jgi:hypothetical protein
VAYIHIFVESGFEGFEGEFVVGVAIAVGINKGGTRGADEGEYAIGGVVDDTGNSDGCLAEVGL